jgi:ABC-type phosphate transport system substrate-binding protein
MMKRIQALAAAAAMSLASSVWADVAVIVNVKNQNTYTGVEQDLIQRIYLGKASQFPDGTKATPYDLSKGDASRQLFVQEVIGKTPSQLHAYWSRRIFSGKQQPPRSLDDAEAMKAAVAADESAIGYIKSTAVDASVAVLFTIED